MVLGRGKSLVFARESIHQAFFFASDLFSIWYFNLLRLVFCDLDSFIENIHEATYV